MPTLTQEQFQKARDSGFTTDQIIGFEKKRLQEEKPVSGNIDSGEIISPASFREQKAASRGGSFDWLNTLGKETMAKPKDFIGNVGRGAQIPLAAITGAANMGESLLSDVALGITEKPKTETFGRHLAETFTGKRTSKFSDVAESVGVPEGLPANTAGLAASFGLSDIAAGGQLSKTVIGGGKKIVSAIGGGVNKVIEATKDGFQTLKGLKLPTTATLEKEQFGIKLAKKARLQTLQESTQQARFNLNKIKDTTQQVFDNNYKVLSNKLKDASEEGVLNFQKSLPEFYKSVGDSYGTALDDVATNLELTRGKLNIQEVNNILRKSIEETTSENLNYGKAYTKLNELWSGKYAVTSTNQANTFSLQEVKADIDQVFKLAKYGVRGTGEDIPAHILRKNWGEFATQNVEGYGNLQKKYSEVVDAMKLSDKLFRPKAGELYAEKGASFLRKFGMAETPSDAQSKLISMVEQGTELGKGVGPLSEPVKQLGAELRVAKEANQIMKTNISNRLDKLSITSSQVRRSLTKEFDTKIDDYTMKLLDRKKAVALARMLGLGTAAAAGAYGLGRGITNVLGFRESYGQ